MNIWLFGYSFDLFVGIITSAYGEEAIDNKTGDLIETQIKTICWKVIPGTAHLIFCLPSNHGIPTVTCQGPHICMQTAARHWPVRYWHSLNNAREPQFNFKQTY